MRVFLGVSFVLVVLLFKSGPTLNQYAGASTASRETSSSQQLAEEKLEDFAAEVSQTKRLRADAVNNRSSTSSAAQHAVHQIEEDIPNISTSDNHRSSTPSHPMQELGQRNIYYNGATKLVNKWYGWQPKIAATMNCSWRECFQPENNCTTCRDSLEDMAVTDASSIDPGPDWIPDVTMLRRMYMDGQDANGNPWPPPLDEELCEVLQNDDFKSTKQALDEIPLKSHPVPRSIPEHDNSKVLCMIYTMEKKHHRMIRAMRETWAPQCDGFLAFSTKSDPRIPAISIPHAGAEEYRFMWLKVKSIWKFVAKHYLSEFDWFYIGGDDLIALPHNLKRFLEMYNSSERHSLGRIFKPAHLAFNTGGGGYALSRAALTCLAEQLEANHPKCSPWKKTSAEDVVTADCLQKMCNVTSEHTWDEQQRQRFHHFHPGAEYTYKGKLGWYKRYTKNIGGVFNGTKCCAPDSTSFHHMSAPMMRYVHHYVHDCNRNV